MKKMFSVLIAIAMMLGTLPAMSATAADSVYELESGTIYDTGDNQTKTITLSGASSGMAVDLRDAGDSVTVNITAASAGSYRLTLRYSQPYDQAGKYQDLLVNGTNAGQLFCGYTNENTFSETDATVYLKAGSNTVTIQGSWGWTILDCLEVSEIASASVDRTLSNPNATAETESLYRFLCDTYGDYVLAGQQESTWMGSEDYEFNIIQNASGKCPALRGFDYMGDDFAGCNRRAMSWYEKGGIVTICWHCGADFSGSHTESMNTDLDWDKALTPGTNEYNALIAGMDKGAAALKELQEAGVPVIWRPFHEFDGQWFWWGKGGAENFKKLWRLMYDRYTNDWGLNNLIWSLGYCGDVNDGWYPGDEYVDIIGADTYVNHTDSLVNMYQKTTQIAGKPVCLHENGPIPDPDKMQADGAKWLWFMTWHTSFIDSNAFNTTSYLNHVYNSDYVLTLDELPDVYDYQTSESESVMGDVNADGTFSVVDVVLFQKWLLAIPDTYLANWKTADFCEDNELNAFDLAMMKRALLAPSEPDEEEPSAVRVYPSNTYQTVPQDYLSNNWAAQGTVERFYYSTTDHTSNSSAEYWKSALVYLPPNYDSSRSYNVMYLMHGGSDSPEWFFGGEGESSNITRMMDSMITKGEMEPLIVCAVSYYEEYQSDATACCVNFYYELMQDVIPAFETKYSTYAENVTAQGLADSRRHRAFAGFSMGSVTTWSVFEHCLDEIAYYMPISGDCWALGGTAGGSQSAQTANYLAECVKTYGMTSRDFFIYSGCGEYDMAEPNLTPQINAMRTLGEPFVYCDNFADGNLYECIHSGGGHDINTVTAVMYNGLPKMFG